VENENDPKENTWKVGSLKADGQHRLTSEVVLMKIAAPQKVGFFLRKPSKVLALARRDVDVIEMTAAEAAAARREVVVFQATSAAAALASGAESVLLRRSVTSLPGPMQELQQQLQETQAEYAQLKRQHDQLAAAQLKQQQKTAASRHEVPNAPATAANPRRMAVWQERSERPASSHWQPSSSKKHKKGRGEKRPWRQQQSPAKQHRARSKSRSKRQKMAAAAAPPPQMVAAA
jgi:hypothetical protein